MTRMTTFIMIITGVTILFYFTGFPIDNPLLDLLINPENLSFTAFWTVIITAITGTVAGIFVGIWSRNIELAAMTAFAPYIAMLLWNVISVFNTLALENRAIAVLIFAPTLFMFIITIVDYWRGRD